MQLNFNAFFKRPSRHSPSQSPLLKIQDQKKLLKANSKSVKSIWQSAGIADEPFEKLYRFAMLRTAELVQSCPATENDHHAWPGGLLAYVLESADYALRLRKGVNLPISGSPEERKKKADLYTYSVFAASLIGEIGASLHHQKITLFSRGRGQLGEWSPLANGIGLNPKAKYLKVEFRQGRGEISRSYSLMYAMRILPGNGLEWIESDPEVLGEFLQAFSDLPGGPIHELAARGSAASAIRAEPLAGAPYFGAEAGPPAERPQASRKETSQGSRSRKRTRTRQPVGSNGSSKPNAAESESRMTEKSRDRKAQPRAKSGPARQKSIGTPKSSPVKDSAVKQGSVATKAVVPGNVAVDDFTSWLEKEIHETGSKQGKEMKLFHVTDRCIFLVHPTIFMEYASENSMDWNLVQRKFVSLGIHEKNQNQKNKDLWKARVPGKKEGTWGFVSGWMVPMENLSLNVELEPNRELKLLDET